VQDVIAKMVAVETEAKRLVAEAEAEARSLVQTAGQQAERERGAALEAARGQARDLLATARREADEERTRILAAGQEATARLVQISPQRLAEAAEMMVRAALGEK
jgi:vacuolar-type H+-ATPase subunit H